MFFYFIVVPNAIFYSPPVIKYAFNIAAFINMFAKVFVWILFLKFLFPSLHVLFLYNWDGVTPTVMRSNTIKFYPRLHPMYFIIAIFFNACKIVTLKSLQNPEESKMISENDTKFYGICKALYYLIIIKGLIFLLRIKRAIIGPNHQCKLIATRVYPCNAVICKISDMEVNMCRLSDWADVFRV